MQNNLKYCYTESQRIASKAGSGGREDLIYYYHGNHLSSTQTITDGWGFAVQQVLYAPFGEVVKERNQNWNNNVPAYLFNAKELDEESGMYYFEARYMKPPTFISRDPLFERYPHFSPYSAMANSPLLYVDPDGNFPVIPMLLWKATGYLMENFSSNNNVKTAGYAMNHPINAVRTGTVDVPTWGISKIASNFQVNLVNEAGFESGDGSQSNAYRHALWQAMLTNKFDAKQATRIGNAHENNLPTNMNQRIFNGEGASDAADQMADLLNNVIGREIGAKNKGASNRNLSEAVLNEYKQNGLWTVSGDDKTGYKVQKTRLSQEEYAKALKVLRTKGEDGLNQ
jgi:RHS repeat-associated protein